MDKRGQENNASGKSNSERTEKLIRAAQNIRTAADFARFMTDVMAGLVSGEISSGTATAICGTANTMLKAIEMQLKYATPGKDGRRTLMLTEGAPQEIAPISDVTHVTSGAPAQPEVARPKQAPSKGPWCAECYVKRKQYIKATEELDGEDLCLSCYNAVNREGAGLRTQ